MGLQNLLLGKPIKLSIQLKVIIQCLVQNNVNTYSSRDRVVLDLLFHSGLLTWSFSTGKTRIRGRKGSIQVIILDDDGGIVDRVMI